MSSWEWSVNTGNPAQDQAMLQHYQQQAASQGMALDVTPSPQGGFTVRARPMNAPPAAPQGFAPPAAPQGFAPPQAAPYGAASPPASPYGAPPPQASPYGAPAPNAYAPPGAPLAAAAMAGGFGGGSSAGPAVGESADTLGPARVKYLRKVYGLLTAAALIAVISGYAVLELMPTETIRIGAKGVFKAPMLVAYMLAYPVVDIAVFGALFVATIIASWVSKVKVLNVIALFGVAALMGIDMSAMVWVATLKAGFGTTLMANPVRDAGITTAAVFLGATMYVFITKKDFSFLGAMLSIGGWVIFGACILTFFFHSEIFVLAVASAGALLSAIGLLWMTSYVLHHSDMDDPVGDALYFLIKLRNLFMFLLRIFMSSRD